MKKLVSPADIAAARFRCPKTAANRQTYALGARDPRGAPPHAVRRAFALAARDAAQAVLPARGRPRRSRLPVPRHGRVLLPERSGDHQQRFRVRRGSSDNVRVSCAPPTCPSASVTSRVSGAKAKRSDEALAGTPRVVLWLLSAVRPPRPRCAPSRLSASRGLRFTRRWAALPSPYLAS